MNPKKIYQERIGSQLNNPIFQSQSCKSCLQKSQHPARPFEETVRFQKRQCAMEKLLNKISLQN